MQPDRMPLRETYRGRWREILVNLGVSEKMLVNRHGPCPVCGGKDRFRFDDKGGHGTFICSQCGAGDGPKLVMLLSGLDFNDAADRIRQAAGGASVDRSPVARPDLVDRQGTDDAKRARMNRLWRKALPIKATDPVGLYLAWRIGRSPTGTGLRFHPACSYPMGADYPAMLACFVGPDGAPSGLHRTYLTGDGRKAPGIPSRLSLGSLVDGGAVRLAPAAAVMGIAEGIETALAASIIFGVPVWAALNANRLAAWDPPREAREVMIFADNDENFVGQLAAFDLEARIRGRVRTTIETPSDAGTDWNDVFHSRRVAA